MYTNLKKDIHKHNDKIDASNLQSKSFQAVFTFRSKLSSQTFWNNNLKWTETWILWHSSRPGLKSWSFACMLQILTFLHQINFGNRNYAISETLSCRLKVYPRCVGFFCTWFKLCMQTWHCACMAWQYQSIGISLSRTDPINH